MLDVKIHGTYPFDDLGADHEPCWKPVRPLSLEEAAELTKLELTTQEDEYLWLNKGYIVLDQEPTLTAATASLVENFARFSERIPAGARAVYLHDGNYQLIERTTAKQTQRL
jgi:hypothetical protein